MSYRYLTEYERRIYNAEDTPWLKWVFHIPSKTAVSYNATPWGHDHTEQIISECEEYKNSRGNVKSMSSNDEQQLLRISNERIHDSFPDNYPVAFKSILAQNNSCIRRTRQDYWEDYKWKAWNKRHKEEGGIPIHPWIYVGNNTQQLIKDLSEISTYIKFKDWYSLRFESSIYINDAPRYFLKDANADNFILNIEVEVEDKVYPVTLAYFKPSWRLEQKSLFKVSVEDDANWKNFINSQIEYLASINTKELQAMALERFIKECRERVGNKNV